MNSTKQHLTPSLYEAFEAQVASQPEKTAIVGSTSTATYFALQINVKKLASLLAEYGLKGCIIATYMPSEIPYISSLLAITSNRSVFAPITETWPEERVVNSLQSSTPELVITTPELLSKLQKIIQESGIHLPVLELSYEQRNQSLTWILHGEVPVQNTLANSLEAEWHTDSLYLLYTSGSTGTPKAVEGCHGALANYIQWQIKTYHIESNVRVAQLALPTFDVSLRDIFLPLCAGGSLHIASASVKYHPMLLANWISQQQITLMHSVPSLFKFALETVIDFPGFDNKFLSLENLFFSGEALRTRDVKLIKPHLNPNIRFVNLYGPTECTLIKVHYELPQDLASIQQDIVPLGYAIDGADVELDTRNESFADGRGEIVLKSPDLAKGYFRNRKATDEKFLSDESGARSYRTGDIGYLDDKGCLHFVGRNDHQVKINGNRVELGEIDSCLLKLPELQKSCTFYLEDKESLNLVSVIQANEPAPADDAIRQHVKNYLPAYMVPTQILTLSDIPINENGKTDRRALLKLIKDKSRTL